MTTFRSLFKENPDPSDACIFLFFLSSFGPEVTERLIKQRKASKSRLLKTLEKS